MQITLFIMGCNSCLNINKHPRNKKHSGQLAVIYSRYEHNEGNVFNIVLNVLEYHHYLVAPSFVDSVVSG